MTDLRKIDVNLIVVLDALLQHRNLTHAGNAIGMSQPAVSGALARLRVQFDDALLIRESKDFQLTPRALEILPLVEDAMVEINRTYALVPDFDPLTSQRTFHIASTDYLLSQIAAPLKQLMATAAPGVTLEFGALSAELDISLIDLVRRDVLVASQDLRMPGKRTKIFDEQLVCVAREGHPLVKNGELSLENLAKSEMVQMLIGKRGTNQVENALADLGITEVSGVSVRSVMAIPALVAGGDMISWLPRRLFNDYQESMKLQIVSTPIPVIEFDESVHWHPSKNSDPAIQWLIASLKEAGSRI
jgi:DNA-binding transcriptional LysR family regulator